MKGCEVIYNDRDITSLTKNPFIRNNFGRLNDNSFWGSNQFVAVNQWLTNNNIPKINWE